MGVPRGPAYRRILDTVRDAQLVQTVKNREEALQLAEETFRNAAAE